MADSNYSSTQTSNALKYAAGGALIGAAAVALAPVALPVAMAATLATGLGVSVPVLTGAVAGWWGWNKDPSK